MKDVRNYQIRSIWISAIGAVMIVLSFTVGYDIGLDDDFWAPIGISMVIFGLARLFFRTMVKSVGRYVFGGWLILFGGYCFFRDIRFLPGMFGFLGGFLLIVLGIVFLMVDF